MKIRHDILLVIAIPIIFVLSLQLVLALTVPSTDFTEERPSQFQVRYDKNKVTLTDVDFRIPNRNYCVITIETDGGKGETYEIEVTLYGSDDNYLYVTSETDLSIFIDSSGSGSNDTAVVEGHIMSPVLSEAVLEDGAIIKVIIHHNNIAELLWNLFIQIDSD